MHKSHILVVLIVNYDYYPRIGISSEGIVVVLCVCVCVCVSECVCVPSFSVLAAATFSLHI